MSNTSPMSNTRRLLLLLVPLVALLGVIAASSAAGAAASGGTTITQQDVTSTGTGRSAADQVRTAELTLLRAAVDGDTHTAGALLVPDLQLIDVTGTPETRADYLANIGGGVDFVTLKPIKPISVRTYGDNAAVARVKLKFKVVAHGQTLQHE